MCVRIFFKQIVFFIFHKLVHLFFTKNKMQKFANSPPPHPSSYFLFNVPLLANAAPPIEKQYNMARMCAFVKLLPPPAQTPPTPSTKLHPRSLFANDFFFLSLYTLDFINNTWLNSLRASRVNFDWIIINFNSLFLIRCGCRPAS